MSTTLTAQDLFDALTETGLAYNISGHFSRLNPGDAKSPAEALLLVQTAAMIALVERLEELCIVAYNSPWGEK